MGVTMSAEGGSSRRAGRRRLAALLVAALVAATVGTIVGVGRGGEERSPVGARTAARPPAPARPVRPGAVILLAFNGTRMPAYVGRILRRRDAAGVFLGPANVASPAQLARLTSALRHAGGADLLVALDQEGGSVRTVPSVGPVTAPPAAGAPKQVRAEYHDAGRGLRALGITVDLAPVTDAARPGTALAARAFPGPAQVAAASAGLAAGGVLPAAKHFPGLGAATANTDDVPVDIPTSAAELERVDLAPFRAAIAAGVPLVMASHARYRALDPRFPASRSRRILTNLLRGRLGFRGVVMTDSLEAAAVLRTTSLERAGIAGLRAGVDLLLTTGRGSWIRLDRALGAEARHSPAFATRLAGAARRVRALRRRVVR